MKKQKTALISMGGSSLLTAFALLCLTALALLSLSTVQAEKRLSDTAARAAAAYYEADLEAERIFARLRAGDEAPGVVREGSVYRYSCRISEHQTLQIELQRTETGWMVLRWQTVAHFEQTEGTLPVWDGA